MSLQALLAAQKAKKESPDEKPKEAATPVVDNAGPVESPAPEAPAEVAAGAKTGLAFLRGAGKPAPVESKPSDAAPASGGLGFLKNRIGSTPATSDSKALVAHSPVPKVAVKEPTGKVEPMGDLDRLLNSEQPTHKSRFQDEIPATGPARDLPPELEPAGKAFVDSLDSIYRVIHEPDLLGGVVRGIMIELQNHPEYRKLIAPADMHTMVRGMRESMGLARIKKEESKAKRSPKAKKTEINDLAVLEALEGMDFS